MMMMIILLLSFVIFFIHSVAQYHRSFFRLPLRMFDAPQISTWEALVFFVLGHVMFPFMLTYHAVRIYIVTPVWDFIKYVQ